MGRETLRPIVINSRMLETEGAQHGQMVHTNDNLTQLALTAENCRRKHPSIPSYCP